jgi:beta-glucosidase
VKPSLYSATRARKATEDDGFPSDFLFGVSTSAYQIDGEAEEDGKGPSIWDAFTARKGTIEDGSTGRVAGDHYHRWREDLEIMQRLGVDACRFSLSWPRILPEARGGVNPRGIGFYDRLVDELLERGIEPWITLYHRDLPLALDHEGGWTRRPIARWFAEYTNIVLHALGDRVTHWITLNEPISVVGAGYASGDRAPGHRSLIKAIRAAHFQLLAHGRAVKQYEPMAVTTESASPTRCRWSIRRERKTPGLPHALPVC